MPDGLYLMATHTCPNCAAAQEKLDAAGLRYQKLYAEENRALAKAWRIMVAPTLVEVKNGVPKNYRGVSEILGNLAQ